MGTWIVSCESCDVSWPRVGAFTEYEREAIESRPCPCCGAYTLTCPGPKPHLKRRTRGPATPTEVRITRTAA